MTLTPYFNDIPEFNKESQRKEDVDIKLYRRSLKYNYDYPAFKQLPNNFYKCNLCGNDYFSTEKAILRHLTSKHFKENPELVKNLPEFKNRPKQSNLSKFF